MSGSFNVRAAALGLAVGLSVLSGVARADAVDDMKAFIRDVKSAQSDFTQTVTAPDGIKKKVSSGTFEFERPNRFRFSYKKPFAQDIVADGQKVWIYDADLNQVSSRRITQAIGATPAALLAGGTLDKDFDLKPLPDRDGLNWAEAIPKQKDGAFRSVQVGFKDHTLAAIEITDGFSQKSLLTFARLSANVSLPPETFQFKIPAGADVIEQ